MTTFKEDAIIFIKTNKKKLVDEFCDVNIYPSSQKPVTFFMAGSPGSGKTEFSKAFINQLEVKDPNVKILRLDVDDLREKIPFYTGDNSDDMQRACTILFDKIYDHILAHSQNVMIDGTFSSPRSIENVERAIKRNRSIFIVYLYQDPIIAWEYTKKREKLEGRTVPKDVFIRAYFEAKKNAQKVKQQFKDEIVLDLFVKDADNNFQKNVFFDIRSLDDHLEEKYTVEYLEQNLPDHI